MARLEGRTRVAFVRGIVPDANTHIVETDWVTGVAVHLTCRDAIGARAGLLLRSRVAGLQVIEIGRPWSADFDVGALSPATVLNVAARGSGAQTGRASAVGANHGFEARQSRLVSQVMDDADAEDPDKHRAREQLHGAQGGPPIACRGQECDHTTRRLATYAIRGVHARMAYGRP